MGVTVTDGDRDGADKDGVPDGETTADGVAGDKTLMYLFGY